MLIFGEGPLCLSLVDFGEFVPFIGGALWLSVAVAVTWIFSDDSNLPDEVTDDKATAFRRSWGIITLAPYCMASSFIFGWMDGVLNGDLPIWGSRVGLSTAQISACLTIFVFGTICAQIPLGYLSDLWGRRETLLSVTLSGAFAVIAVHFVNQHFYLLAASFFIMGASLGPTYSLGLAFLGDTVKSDDITLANVLYMMAYGLGSLFGPFFVSLLINITQEPGYFVWVSLAVLVGYLLTGILDSHLMRTILRNAVGSK